MGKLEKRFPVYSQLIKLYPASYQKRYGQQMLQTLADMLDGGRSRASVWLRVAADLPFSLLKQNVVYTGGIMKSETPNYVKINSLVGAAMLLPFFAALVANGLNKLLYNQDLYHSWLWSAPVLFVWVIALPTAAALLALVSLFFYLRSREKDQKVGWLKGPLDVRRDWPLVIVALVGLAIMGMVRFHDSVHCLTGNPINEIKNSAQTWHCIEQKPTIK